MPEPQEVAASNWKSLSKGGLVGGGTYQGIPAAVVVGAVMPPEEAVAAYPGDSSTTWLHDGGGAGE